MAAPFRFALCLSPLAIGACSFEWGVEQPAVTLVGGAPSLNSYKRLNSAPAGGASIMEGADGAPWAAFCEYRSSSTLATLSGRNCKVMHLVRLTPTTDGSIDDEVVTADTFVVSYFELYGLTENAQGTARTLTLHRPGDPPATDVSVTMATGPTLISIAGAADDVFTYFTVSDATTHYDVFSRDGRARLTLPVPAGVDPTNPGANLSYQLTGDGSLLVVRGPTNTVTSYETAATFTTTTSYPLGMRPPDYFLYGSVVLFVGDDFRSVPIRGGRDTLITSATFDPATLYLDGQQAWFVSGNLFRVPLDGSAAPTLVQTNVARLLGFSPTGQPVFSRDPGDRYVNGAGDGWLGDWNFMQRGLYPTYDDSGTHLHFLEHAATIAGVGTLTSVTPPAAGATPGAPVTLALNCYGWAELDHDRLLVIDNHAEPGNWNRLLAIDETKATADWLISGSDDFALSPDGATAIVDVVSGASGYDIYQVPIPPAR